jgi:hypothetical protein
MLCGARLVLVLGVLGLAGCGGKGRVAVEGTVTYDGQPIQAGSIAFLAAEGQGVNTGGAIVDGKYAIAADVGPKMGKNKVEIRWAKPTGKTYQSETGATLSVTAEGLPAKYNDQSELTAQVERGQNTINFDLKK